MVKKDVRQPHVGHGELVRYDEIRLQHALHLLAVLVAGQPQGAVHGHGLLPSRALRHPAARPSRGRCQQHAAAAQFPMHIEQYFLYGCLSCPGAAGDDADRMAERLPDALLLFRGKADAQLFLRLRKQESNILFLLFCRKQGYQILCRIALIPVHIRRVKRPAFIVHPPFLHQLVEHLVDCHLRDGLTLVALVQLSICFLLELLLVLVQMPFLHILFHAVPDASFDPHGIVRLSLVGFCNLVHGQKAEAADPAQREGLVLYRIQRRISKFLVDLLYLFGCHLKRRQVSRKVPHGMAALVG